jgi:DNA modification methylase
MLQVVEVPVDQIIPYARNARTHDNSQDKLVASIKEYGFKQPILVDTEMVIITGHNRYQAAKRIGYKTLPIMVADNLSDAQIKAYRLADNRIGEDSDWDNDLLKIEMGDLQGLDFDLAFTGFDAKEIEAFIENKLEETNDADATPILEEIAVSRLGDLWQLGDHLLICADSTKSETLQKLLGEEKVDLVFTDPPYGMSYKGSAGIIGDDNRGDDLKSLIYDSVNNAIAYSKASAHYYICLTWRTYGEFYQAISACGLKVKACIVWDKQFIGLGTLNYRPQHEFIFHCHDQENSKWNGSKSQSDVWSIARVCNTSYVHPTQKPVELVGEALVNSSVEEDIILDIFGGSGTTLMACERLNRQARLVELDPKYMDVIIKRWQEYTGKAAILRGTKSSFDKISGERNEARNNT